MAIEQSAPSCIEGVMDTLLGALAGDIIGSRFEINNHKETAFDLVAAGCQFTDDTVLTVATMDKILYGGRYADVYQHYGRRFPDAGYGGTFAQWIFLDNPQPYGSWGNGSAMRVSPVGWAFDTVDDILREAEASAAVSHDHPEGIKGAQAIALAVFRARTGTDKTTIQTELADRFGYNLDTSVETMRPGYHFDVSCQGSVPQAVRAFLEADCTESAIRLAVSLGGDTDTIACMAGAIAQAAFGELPEVPRTALRALLPPALVNVHDEFCERFCLVRD